MSRANTFEKLNTPCYIYRPSELVAGVDCLFEGFRKHWPNAIAGYSFKTNSLPFFLSELRAKGFYAEVVSGDEYRLALHLGFDHIIYNGPVKDEESFCDALSKGHIINLDAERELGWLESYIKSGKSTGNPPRIGLRVNFNLEELCPGETSAGTDGSRFGFSYETGAFARALLRLSDMGVPLSGIHLHFGSKTRSVNIYKGLARMAVRLKREFDLKLSYVDMGGGYFGGMPGRPEFPDYIEEMSKILKEEFTPNDTTLILEPGTSLASRSFDYLTRVVDVKDTHAGRFVTIDGSRCDVDPLHTKSGYLYEVIESGQKGEQTPSQIISGYTCMENDRLMEIKEAPALSRGDALLIKKAGGYTMCLTPLFIKYFPEVYREGDDGYISIRRHWGPAEYTALCDY